MGTRPVETHQTALRCLNLTLRVLNGEGKAARMSQVPCKELNGSEPPMRCRKKVEIRKPVLPLDRGDKCADCQTGRVARTGSGIKAAGPCRRLWHGTGEATESGLTGRLKWSPHEAERREGFGGGRWIRSSEEGSVMGLERRGPRSGERWRDNFCRPKAAKG
jgi:ribosomal protein L37AE/L43A